MEVEAISKKNLTPTDGEENQEINDIPVIEVGNRMKMVQVDAIKADAGNLTSTVLWNYLSSGGYICINNP